MLLNTKSSRNESQQAYIIYVKETRRLTIVKKSSYRVVDQQKIHSPVACVKSATFLSWTISDGVGHIQSIRGPHPAALSYVIQSLITCTVDPLSKRPTSRRTTEHEHTVLSRHPFSMVSYGNSWCEVKNVLQLHICVFWYMRFAAAGCEGKGERRHFILTPLFQFIINHIIYYPIEVPNVTFLFGQAVWGST